MAVQALKYLGLLPAAGDVHVSIEAVEAAKVCRGRLAWRVGQAQCARRERHTAYPGRHDPYMLDVPHMLAAAEYRLYPM